MPAALSMAAATSACAQNASAPENAGSRTLVAFCTRSGNTRVIAKTLQRDLGADIFEIRPLRPYPEDYEQNVEQARQERDRGIEPPLAGNVPDFARYDIVYLGFPIWGETTPPVVRTFLRIHNFGNKTLRPFITHGGYGVGSSLTVLKEHAAGAKIDPPFVIEADQERRTMTQVRQWLTNKAIQGERA